MVIGISSEDAKNVSNMILDYLTNWSWATESEIAELVESYDLRFNQDDVYWILLDLLDAGKLKKTVYESVDAAESAIMGVPV